MNQTPIRQDQNYGFLYHFYSFEMSSEFPLRCDDGIWVKIIVALLSFYAYFV